MTDARNNRICPIFRTADVDGIIGGETRSFLEAHKWFEEGRKVSVIFNGELIGEMRMGEPIDGLDDIYKLNPNEPYGTIHYAKEQHSYYINLPDRLLTPEEVVYIPTPIDTADVVLPADVQSLIEKLAENTHEVWAKNRKEQGWTYGAQRDDAKKETPCMLPYDMLDDSEKEYDRATAYETLALICKLGYKIVKADE